MVAELTENIAGWERIRSALDDIRACHGETSTFFNGVFDQLDSLRGSLLSREQQIEKQVAARREVVSAPNAANENHWELLRKEFEEDRAEIYDTKQAVQRQIEQISAAVADFAKVGNEFHAVRDELVRHSEELTAVRSQALAASQENESGVKDKIRDMEQQKSLLEKDRAIMEMELKSARSRVADMEELLAELKRSADPRQNSLAEELQQMRTALETLTRQTAENKRPVEPAPAVKPAKGAAAANLPTGVAAVALGDPVLESVMAQFEILQQDRLARRSETA